MKATDQQSNLFRLKGAIEDLAETPKEKKPETAIAFAASGSYENGIQWAVYQVRFYDCELDLIPGVVHWLKSDHYEVCNLYLGAQISELWSDGHTI